MSAIVAIFPFGEFRFQPGRAESMLASLSHRGGDGGGVWSDGCVELGCRLLWTTEESVHESIPFRDPASGRVIACDARIDNRSDLISELGLLPDSAFPITDSRIILSSYEKWGEQCLPRLLGDFTFTIWDPNHRSLFCARDPLGVRHFYYCHVPGKFFALASEIKALWQTGEIRDEVDEVGLGDYLLFNFEDKVGTFFKGVKRLPATHALAVDSNGIRVWEYWRPDFDRRLNFKDKREYPEAFREHFSRAVECRLRGVSRVGSFLSGGLDSSSITCVANGAVAKRHEPLHSFSAVWPQTSASHPKLDESSYMRAVIEGSGCTPHFVSCDGVSPWEDIEKLIWHADHPVGFPNMYVHWEVYKRAHKEGVKILLDGFDGDTTVSHGYEAFEAFARGFRFLRLYNEAKLLKRNIPIRFHSFENLVLKRGITPCIPPRFKSLWHLVSRRGPSADTRSPQSATDRFRQVLDQDFFNDYQEKRNLQEFYVVDTNLRNGRRRRSEDHWNNLTSGMFARCLEVSELASQAFGIDSRFPFFDRRLIEFCLAVPVEERVRDGWTRAVFRSAMKGILPEQVRLRGSKANLGIGLKLNMIKHARDELEQVVSSEMIRPFVNRAELEKVWFRFEKDPLKTFDSDCLTLVAVVHFSKWLKKRVAKPGIVV